MSETDNLPTVPIGSGGIPAKEPKAPKEPKAKKQTKAAKLAEAGVTVKKKAKKKGKTPPPKPAGAGVNALLRPLRALEAKKAAELEAVRAQIRRTRKLV